MNATPTRGGHHNAQTIERAHIMDLAGSAHDLFARRMIKDSEERVALVTARNSLASAIKTQLNILDRMDSLIKEFDTEENADHDQGARITLELCRTLEKRESSALITEDSGDWFSNHRPDLST